MKQSRPTVLYAAAVRDAAGLNARPGAVLVLDGRVVAAGEPGSIPAQRLAQAEVIERPGDLLLPAMVNAHTHLELTAIGPQPYDPAGGFMGWVQGLRQRMPRTPDALAQSTRQGVARSLADGVQAVGDIASTPASAAARRTARLTGVTYRECFGLGPPHDQHALQTIAQSHEGLQPHAPYSAGPAIYEAAGKSGRPICTHLAETRDEVDFVAKLAGPMLDYLKQIGKWDDAFAKHYGQGLSPVRWLQPYLQDAANDGGWLVAHCNYVDDDDIKLLADTNTAVTYCPIASAYFGHGEFPGGHRYHDMLASGINVCLGTDSIVGTDPHDPQPLGLLSAIRLLYRRDKADPDTLLKMATINGARALRMEAGVATLGPGAPARFVCTPIAPDDAADPLEQALTGQAPLEAIWFD